MNTKEKEEVEIFKRCKISIDSNTNSDIFTKIILMIIIIFALIGIFIKRIIKKRKKTTPILKIKIDMEKRIKKKKYK